LGSATDVAELTVKAGGMVVAIDVAGPFSDAGGDCSMQPTTPSANAKTVTNDFTATTKALSRQIGNGRRFHHESGHRGGSFWAT
jgi:hypothetical protein